MDELSFHRRLHRPGTVLDIGAHDGAFTLPFSMLPGTRVIAFEPLPAAFDRLAAALDPLPPHVTLRQEALGDRDGVVTLNVPLLDGAAQEQWASIAKDYAAVSGSRVRVARHEVRLRRLDDLGLNDVTAIKLDAEGAEYEVLRGGRETLLCCRPVLSVEIEERHREGATWAVPAYLDALGYDGFWEFYGAWHPIASFDRARMHRASPDPSRFEASDPYIFVFYFLPRELAADCLERLRA